MEEEGPRWELIRQLIEYKKFKDAADFLQRRELEQENFFPSVPEEPDEQGEEEEGDQLLADVGIFDLIRAFQQVLSRFEEESEFEEIVDDRFTVSDKIDHLLKVMEPGQSARFSDLFVAASTKSEVIVTFLALLELIKLMHFRIQQEGILGEIEVYRNENL